MWPVKSHSECHSFIELEEFRPMQQEEINHIKHFQMYQIHSFISSVCRTWSFWVSAPSPACVMEVYVVVLTVQRYRISQCRVINIFENIFPVELISAIPHKFNIRHIWRELPFKTGKSVDGEVTLQTAKILSNCKIKKQRVSDLTETVTRGQKLYCGDKMSPY